jgi:uncharacterized protein
MTGPVRIMLRVSPGSRRTAVIGRYLDGWKISVAAVPEHGKANEEIVRVLADVLALPKRQIAIVSGGSARTKIVEVDGMTLAAVDAAFRKCLPGRNG